MRQRTILMIMSVMLSCSTFAQNLSICVGKNGKIGFVDEDGARVIKCEYESAYPFENGYAIVTKSKKMGVIDVTGKVVLPISYTSILPWAKNIYMVTSGKKVGLASYDGKIVLPVKYSHISKPNCYGKAMIAEGGQKKSVEKKQYLLNAKLGIINVDGSIAIAPEYRGIREFSVKCTSQTYVYGEGYAIKPGMYYLNDTLQTDCSYIAFNNSSADFSGSGIMDGKGKILLQQKQYDFVTKPQDGMVRYYNAKIKEVTCGYHDLNAGSGFVATKFDKGWNDLKFWTHGDFYGKLAPVNKGKTWSFVDKSGKEVRTGFKAIMHNYITHLWAGQNASNLWTVFDEQNREEPSLCNYSEIRFPANEGDMEIFAVRKQMDWGAITRNGEVVLPFEQYQEIGPVSYGFIAVKKDGKWGAVNPKGQELVPIQYDEVSAPSGKNESDIWVANEDKIDSVLYYHYNFLTKVQDTTAYTHVYPFCHGTALGLPKGMIIANNAVNRALLPLQNGNLNVAVGEDMWAKLIIGINKVQATDSLTNVTFDAAKSALFGLIIDSDGEVLFDLPITLAFKDKVLAKLKAYGNRPLNETEKKDILLDLTKANRSYGLKETLSEDEWNY